MSESKISVLGAGNWGSALAILAARCGHRVSLWAREDQVRDSINETHRNPLYLKEAEFPDSVVATSTMAESVEGASLVVLVIPSQFVRVNIRTLRDELPTDAPIVICSKGIEKNTLMLMHDVLCDELPGKYHPWLAVLSGPSFAVEVASGMPTNVTVAARRVDVARRVQQLLGHRTFRIYTTLDVTGVEVGGALKNVIAIAAGACDGFGFGYNTKAGLITRGLAEMTRMAVALGGDPLTLGGLSGVGDLVLTCTGHLSRNRSVGEAVARGKDPRQVLEHMVAEGVETSRSAHALATTLDVDMPIVHEVHAALHEGKPAREALESLLSRELKEEIKLG